MKFKHVVCGGTFDHLHLGHEKLLSESLNVGERATVGITNKALLGHKAYPFSIESYSIRAKNVLHFSSKFTICELNDIFGPTLLDPTIDAICVTQDTLSGAEAINMKRIQVGMTALKIITIPFAYDSNQEKISSERIRQGTSDRVGNRYDTYLFSKQQHVLPESIKRYLREPLGRTISSISLLSKSEVKKMQEEIANRGYFYQCAVGDMVCFELRKKRVGPFLSLIDGISQRKALNSDILDSILEKDCYKATNEKGTIQKNACIEIQKLFDIGHKRAIKQIFVQGEEDLLTLAVVLFAPLGAHVWYGQQGVGAVDVLVTEKIKQTVYNLVRKFI